jgi:hypothetical protein
VQLRLITLKCRRLLCCVADIIGAELDANCTGLFKLTLDVATSQNNNLNALGPLVRLFQTPTGAPVSVVCKAEDTAQLADWLDALLDTKYSVSRGRGL